MQRNAIRIELAANGFIVSVENTDSYVETNYIATSLEEVNKIVSDNIKNG